MESQQASSKGKSAFSSSEQWPSLLHESFPASVVLISCCLVLQDAEITMGHLLCSSKSTPTAGKHHWCGCSGTLQPSASKPRDFPRGCSAASALSPLGGSWWQNHSLIGCWEVKLCHWDALSQPCPQRTAGAMQVTAAVTCEIWGHLGFPGLYLMVKNLLHSSSWNELASRKLHRATLHHPSAMGSCCWKPVVFLWCQSLELLPSHG